MLNKCFIVIISVLFCFCILFYNLWDNTKAELQNVKAEKVTLEQEIIRRNENAKKLEERISKLRDEFEKHSDWANTPVPADIANRLRK